MKQCRIGLVGCGHAGLEHLKEMRRVPGIEVAGIADLRREVVVGVGREFGIKNQFTDYRKMLSNIPLDGLAVITSADAHFPVADYALAHGLHVLCEKPLTVEPADSRRLVAQARRNDRILAVTFTYRFVPDTRAIKEWIDAGRIGRVVEMRFTSLNGKFAKYPAGSDLRRTFDTIYSGVKGIIFDCGVHAFDLLCWYAGSRVKRVDARAACHLGYHYPDSATAIMEFENGIKAVYDYGKLPYYEPDMPSNTLFMIVITGLKGSIVWHFGGRGGPRRKTVLRLYTARGTAERLFPIYSKERSLQYRQFAAGIRKGRLTGFFPSPEEASYATELTDRVVEEGMRNLISPAAGSPAGTVTRG